MPNDNCLAGIKCPHCGYEENFKIEARVLVDITDDGTDPFRYEGCEWDGGSYIRCVNCNHEGTVDKFTIGE